VLAPDSSAGAIIQDIVELGDVYDVEVKGMVRTHHTTGNVILPELKLGGYNLLVMGVSPRTGGPLFFGDVASELLERAERSLVFLASGPAVSA
jgi:nucleotide-binding universal stress UspA family protein